MTKEQLKEMAKRLDKNNKQLHADLEMLRKEREDDKQSIHDNFMKLVGEAVEILDILPREILEVELRGDFSMSDEMKISLHMYRHSKDIYNFEIRRLEFYYSKDKGYWYESTARDGRVDYNMTNKVDALENRDYILKELTESVGRILEWYNDCCVQRNRKALELTTQYKAASEMNMEDENEDC